MVMGPSCGLVLADLGAEVIKVEPLAGDNTRRLEAAGAGFFPVFNRNKKSLAVDLQKPEGRDLVLRLLKKADVLTENFRPGALDKLGFSYDALSKEEPEAHLLLAEGLPQGPVRAPPRARRGDADDGRPRLHDRAARPPAARRLLGDRHHGRHLRRGRHPRRAARAREDRPRHATSPARCSRAPPISSRSTWRSSSSPARRRCRCR